MALPDRKRNRLLGYDYSTEGLYFVTACVLEKACVFGVVANGEMQLNEFGRIAENQWQWLLEQYPYVFIHAFVVMPNHVHAIIQIDPSLVGTGRDLSAHSTNQSAYFPDLSALTTNLSAPERLSIGDSDESLYKKGDDPEKLRYDSDMLGNDSDSTVHDSDSTVHDSDRSRPVPTRVKSLSGLMGAYKTTTSKLIRQAGLVDFAWQRSFHDHIIRHEKAYRQIEQYIHHNPALWDNDVFYQETHPPTS
ncbi:transposase [Pontibacter indicus]|uniref:Transposase IS200-like domain-containing protein n=1 Tax=Pontibacter indicus TaxID=1317125 RepID=A0A1R3WKM7_9BACT|nr:transposase [Pontibacter indicus]SIT78382.1 hypothetical protein SAMN05444128_0619 [Pontibacter indicus]